jgi:hypothetical protein
MSEKKELTDHEMILEMHTLMQGINGIDGCFKSCIKMKEILYGNPLSTDDTIKEGVINTLRRHLQDEATFKEKHEAFRMKVWSTLIGLLGIVGALTAVVIQHALK